jgi:hypothetical protein
LTQAPSRWCCRRSVAQVQLAPPAGCQGQRKDLDYRAPCLGLWRSFSRKQRRIAEVQKREPMRWLQKFHAFHAGSDASHRKYLVPTHAAPVEPAVRVGVGAPLRHRFTGRQLSSCWCWRELPMAGQRRAWSGPTLCTDYCRPIRPRGARKRLRLHRGVACGRSCLDRRSSKKREIPRVLWDGNLFSVYLRSWVGFCRF